MTSAGGVPGPACQPAPTSSPSRTTTAPTNGLGETSPAPRAASSSALRIWAPSTTSFPGAEGGKAGRRPPASPSPFRTVTVGPGFPPGQPLDGAQGVADSHRRWGIPPRPEDELLSPQYRARGAVLARPRRPGGRTRTGT